MKKLQLIVIIYLFLVLLLANSAFAQTQGDTTKMYVVVVHDGHEFVGRIISQDVREVLIETESKGQIGIPKYAIKEIREIQPHEFSPTGVYIPNEIFSTRYFITTNGLPIEKGESYVLWNLYGPDFQFGVGKNFGMGIMTTWFASPIIASAKYSISLSEKSSLGLGALLGTGSWARPDFGVALPFASLTFGDRKANISFSAGYGAVTYKTYTYSLYNSGSPKEVKHNDQRLLLSTAFMFKVGRRVSFVFDTFIVPNGKSYYTIEETPVYDPNTGTFRSSSTRVEKQKHGFALIIPGIRWQNDNRSAIQFGFTGLKAKGEWAPMPIPMIQWFRKI